MAITPILLIIPLLFVAAAVAGLVYLIFRKRKNTSNQSKNTSTQLKKMNIQDLE